MFDAEVYNKLRLVYAKSGSIEALNEVRNYLDSVGYFMPKPKFYFKSEDRSTWRFLDNRISKSGNITTTYNPSFAYI